MKILKRLGLLLLLMVLILAVLVMQPIEDPTPNYMADHFEKFEQYLEKRDERNIEVSQADLAWHLDHILKTMNTIYDAVEQSETEKFPGSSFSIQKKMLFLMGDFPRGVAQAPESVRPPEVILTDDLLSQLERSKRRMNDAHKLDPGQYFDHPVFGPMGRNEAIRFIRIHTDHHYKIIEDILIQ